MVRIGRASFALCAFLALCFTAGAAAEEEQGAVPRNAITVVGSAVVAAREKTAIMEWSYERNGERVATTRPPEGLHLTRLWGSVPTMVVRLPTDWFGIKLGADGFRIFDEPLAVRGSDPVTCTCKAVRECGQGSTFRCDAEGYLAPAD